MCIYRYFINLNICHRYESIVLEYIWMYDYIDLECIWIVYINKKNKNKNRIMNLLLFFDFIENNMAESMRILSSFMTAGPGIFLD